MLEFCADILNVAINRPVNVETTATGVAFLAGLASGFWKSKEELKELHTLETVFRPKLDESKRKDLLNGWFQCVSRTITNASCL